MGLNKLKSLLENDNRLVSEIDFWGEILPKAIKESYDKDMDFSEFCDLLDIPEWEREYLTAKVKVVKDLTDLL